MFTACSVMMTEKILWITRRWSLIPRGSLLWPAHQKAIVIHERAGHQLNLGHRGAGIAAAMWADAFAAVVLEAVHTKILVSHFLNPLLWSDVLNYVGENLLDRSVGIDSANAIGILLRETVEPRADAAEEILLFDLQPIQRRAACHSRARAFAGNIEKKRAVGLN